MFFHKFWKFLKKKKKKMFISIFQNGQKQRFIRGNESDRKDSFQNFVTIHEVRKFQENV